MKTLRHIGLAALLLATLVMLGGCRQDMQDQPKLEAFETSDFFANGVANQTPPEGTVARGLLKEDSHFYFARNESGALVDDLPEQVEWSRELLERGQDRFDIYCSVCHDQAGSGRGMIVRRGFKQPQPLYEDRLVEKPIGYFYDVITNGFGIMPAYKIQVWDERDRWAIAAYVRVLQASQGRKLSDLPADLQQEFLDGLEAQAEAKKAAEEAAAHGGSHGDDGNDHGAGH